MKKLLNKKGFTLMEMMIVIAIIVILVAIAVPSFNSSLNRANAATDAANLRAAKSAALIKANETNKPSGTFYYDLDDGVLYDTSDSTHKADSDTGSCTKHNSDYIEIVITNGIVTSCDWTTGGACTE